MNYTKMILLVICSLGINTMVKSMEVQQYIPEDKIFVVDRSSKQYKFFRLGDKGSQLEIDHEELPKKQNKFYCAKVLIDKKSNENNIFIRPLGEVTPDCVNIYSLKKYSRLSISLTQNQLKQIKKLTKGIVIENDKIIDELAKDVVVLDNLNNFYRIVGVRNMSVKK